MPSIRICSTRSDPIREMHSQSFGNPSQYAEEKRGFYGSESIWRPDSTRESSRIVGNAFVTRLGKSWSSYMRDQCSLLVHANGWLRALKMISVGRIQIFGEL